MYIMKPIILDAIAVDTLPNGMPVSTFVLIAVIVAVVAVVTILLIRRSMKKPK